MVSACTDAVIGLRSGSMSGQTHKPMYRKYVIAGNYDQYRRWMREQNAHPDAAVYVRSPVDLFGLDPAGGEIELVGEYWKSEAYDSVALARFQSHPRAMTG